MSERNSITLNTVHSPNSTQAQRPRLESLRADEQDMQGMILVEGIHLNFGPSVGRLCLFSKLSITLVEIVRG